MIRYPTSARGPTRWPLRLIPVPGACVTTRNASAQPGVGSAAGASYLDLNQPPRRSGLYSRTEWLDRPAADRQRTSYAQRLEPWAGLAAAAPVADPRAPFDWNPCTSATVFRTSHSPEIAGVENVPGIDVR